ncbi:translocation/assembly module TamB domain-containing protein [Enterovibrio sp. 27052020O]|uniref:autotransporter assembly complex protein TamB n=1 Tax=Enterovibrio sp. 27052020O TaxID=3241166 RepID=UPI00388D5198
MRWLNRFVIAIVFLLVLVVLAVGALLLTPAGVRIAVWGAQEAVPELTIEKSRGSLLNGFTLNGISYQSPTFSLTGKSLSLDIESKCLSGPALCIDGLTADGLVVTVSETEPSPEEPSAPLARISTPIPVFLTGVSLSDISLDILGTKVHWDSLTAAAQMQRDTLTLKPTKWQGINLELAASSESEETKTDTSANTDIDASSQGIVLPEVTLPLNVVIERFELKDATLLLPEKQVIHQFLLVGKAAGSDITLSQVVLDAEQGKVSLNGNVALAGDYPLTVEADASIRMPPLGGHSLSLDAKGDLSALALGAQLKGTLLANLSGKLNVLNPNLPFDLLLNSKNLQWPIDTAAEYRLRSTSLNARGSLKRYNATLKTSASGDAIPDMALSTKLSGDLSEITLSDFKLMTLGGDIAGTANVGWADKVKWETALDFNDIQPGLKWPEAEGKLSGQFENNGELTSQGGWKISVPELDIKGIVRDQALTLVGQVDASDVKGKGDIKVETQGLSLRHGPNQVAVSGRIDNTLALNLKLNLPKLSASLPQAGGSIQGDVALSGTLKKPTASMTLNAKTLRWEQLVKVQSVNVRGSVTPLPIVSGGLIVDVTGLKAEGVDVSQLSLRASGDEKDQTLTVSLKGKPVGADLALRGSLDRNKGWKGTLYESKLSTPVGPWKLANDVPLGFDLKTSKVDVGAFCLMQSQSRICLDKRISVSDSGAAKVSIVDFNLDIIQSFLPVTTTLSGALNANADVAWKPNVLPTVKASVSLGKGQVVEQLDQPFTLGWDKTLLNATLKDNKLNADLLIDVTNNGSISLNALMTNLSGKKRALQSTFDINAINLDLLTPLFGEESKFAGMLNGNVVINGDLNAPTANGSIKLTGLELQSQSAPVEVRQGNVAIALTGKQGSISGDIKTPDGDLVLSGDADWRDLNAWLASLNVKGERLKVVVPPIVALEVSPDMTLKATPQQIDVTGNVSVPWGRIVVESLPPSAVQVSSDVVILNDQLKPVSENESSPITVNAQIAVNIGNDVRLEAFGLKTNLVGKLDVGSNSKGPSVSGEINLKEGTYRSFGQDLLIKKGQILFNGPPEQPYLQVEAIRNPNAINDGVEAGIRVTGPADSPEVQVFSDPAMPQANALSYLTRGQNLDSESDGNAMTSMLIGLGLSQSGKLVGQIGEAFGVQDLSLDTSGSGDDEKVEVSGYILPGLQVKYGVGIFTSLPEFTVRYRLLSDLYVEAVSGADNAVDLLYQFSIK